ncbi:hypothetical protein OAR11_00185 [Alphaproteobacteria bacterium]|nr:hypothetical protein [Alphaproteobacteria bacterium]
MNEHIKNQITNLDLAAKAKREWSETLRIYRRVPEARIASSLSPSNLFITEEFCPLIQSSLITQIVIDV